MSRWMALSRSMAPAATASWQACWRAFPAKGRTGAKTVFQAKRNPQSLQLIVNKEQFMKSISTLTLAAVLSLAASAAFAQSAAPTDAQIAGIVVAANTVDIDAGKLAEAKSTDKEVKKFAGLMVNDHTGVNKQASALVARLKVKPEDSDISKSLKDDGAANIKRLQGLAGKPFDRAYVDNEVSYHQAVIDALDKTLIPSATNAELKDLLVKVRPAFVAHLAHAKQLQASLK
jgi:putative membrane protein